MDHEKMWQELGFDVPLHKELIASINTIFQSTVLDQHKRPGSMEYFDHVLRMLRNDAYD